MEEVLSTPGTSQRTRKTGIHTLGDVPSGTHSCQFYQTKQDLFDILVPYFKAGLEENEFCLWVTSEPLRAQEAKATLRRAVGDLDEYIAKGQIEIVDQSQWSGEPGKFEARRALHGWVEKQKQAAEIGFGRLRLSWDTSWVVETDWGELTSYEAALDNVIDQYQMLAICSYCLDMCSAPEIIHAVGNHQLAFVKEAGRWEAIESIGRRRAENLIARQAQIIDEIHDAMVALDLDGYVMTWNNGAVRLYGYMPEEATGKHIAFLFPREDHDFVRNRVIAPVMEKGGHEVEARLLRKSGEEAYVRLFLSLLRDGNGSATSIIACGVDITESRQVQEALRLSRESFSKAFHSSPDPILISTLRHGRIIEANDSLVRTTGYRREELIGRTSMELGLWLKQKERTNFTHLLQKQKFVHDLEVNFRMKMGEIRVGLLSAQVINIGGEPCSVAIMHDITERKKAEEELRRSQEQLRNLSEHLQRAREEEREGIAREIHDELGQVLTALKMDLSWLGKRLPFDKESLHEKVEAMSKLIDTTAQTVKRISTQLRPGLLDDLGLVPAIEWQAQQFQERTQIPCELELETDDIVLDRELVTAFFRIFQEALTNVARHADATLVKVTLKSKDGKLLLRVSDNGRGITKQQISHPKSFGLLGMRERARFWRGAFKVSGVQGKGTTVTASIPLSLKGGSR
jgi:PAS domain S-box-containing protein